MMTSARRRQLAAGVVGAALTVAGIAGWAPPAVADGCPPGFTTNPYNGQCLAPVTIPTIAGVPCVASKLGLCQSFLQNLQPPSRP